MIVCYVQIKRTKEKLLESISEFFRVAGIRYIKPCGFIHIKYQGRKVGRSGLLDVRTGVTLFRYCKEGDTKWLLFFLSYVLLLDLGASIPGVFIVLRFIKLDDMRIAHCIMYIDHILRICKVVCMYIRLPLKVTKNICLFNCASKWFSPYFQKFMFSKTMQLSLALRCCPW